MRETGDTSFREPPSRLTGRDDVTPKSQRLSNDGSQMSEKSFIPSDGLPLLGPNDNDLSRILDDILDVESPGNKSDLHATSIYRAPDEYGIGNTRHTHVLRLPIPRSAGALLGDFERKTHKSN